MTEIENLAEAKKNLDSLEKIIQEHYGEPCWHKRYSPKNRGFNFNCSVCQVWMALEILQDHLWVAELHSGGLAEPGQSQQLAKL
jgi:hypothetical protein